jgi:hypothetical protein
MVALCFLQDLSEPRLQFLDRKLVPLFNQCFPLGSCQYSSQAGRSWTSPPMLVSSAHAQDSILYRLRLSLERSLGCFR